MTETDPLCDVIDRVLSRMSHIMERLSYRLRSGDDSSETREVIDEHLGEIAYESEVIAFYMAEYPPLITHTEWGTRAVQNSVIVDHNCFEDERTARFYAHRDNEILVTRQVTDWEPIKNLSPSTGHVKNRAETLHMEEA